MSASGQKRTLGIDVLHWILMNLKLNGHVVDGCKQFKEKIVLPPDLLKDDPDWINVFVQGTLNVKLDPTSMALFEVNQGLHTLDINLSHPPHVYRDGREIENNTIQPTNDLPFNGDFQLWRANLMNGRLGTSYNCYLIRRVGSGYQDIAEILGSFHFRSKGNFLTGDPVKVDVYFSNP
ncbi:hypothetical protein ACFL3K_02080, partial [Pseudomonadota bacterium]